MTFNDKISKVQFTTLYDFTTECEACNDDLKPGAPAHAWGRGARLPLRACLCICIFLHRGRLGLLTPFQKNNA